MTPEEGMPPPTRPSHEEIEQKIEIWKKIIDVQQHFNDIEMRIRNYALTIMGAFVAAIGFTLKEKLVLDILNCKINFDISLKF